MHLMLWNIWYLIMNVKLFVWEGMKVRNLYLIFASDASELEVGVGCKSLQQRNAGNAKQFNRKFLKSVERFKSFNWNVGSNELVLSQKKEGGSIAFNAYHQSNSQLQTPIYNQRPGRSHKRTITTESTKKVNTGILVREQEITSTFQALQSSWSCPCGEKSWESFYESKLSGRASGSFVWFSSWSAKLRKLPPYIYISDTTQYSPL